jgi:hypothetical protein
MTTIDPTRRSAKGEGMKDNEKFYDAEIAPVLLSLSKKCEEHGVGFIAVVEYKENERGETYTLPKETSLSMIMIKHCAKTGENIDGYVIGLLRYLRKIGVDYKSSLVLTKMAGPDDHSN